MMPADTQTRLSPLQGGGFRAARAQQAVTPLAESWIDTRRPREVAVCTSGSVQTLFKTPHWEAPDPCFRPCFRNHRRDIVHTWSRHSSRAQRHVPRRDVADRVVYPDYTLYYADTLLRRRIVSALAGRRGIEFDIRPLFHGQGAIDEFSLSGGQPVDDSCSSLKTSFCQGRGRRQTKSQEPPIRQITIHSLEFSFAVFLSDWGEHRQIVGGRVSAPSQRRPIVYFQTPVSIINRVSDRRPFYHFHVSYPPNGAPGRVVRYTPSNSSCRGLLMSQSRGLDSIFETCGLFIILVLFFDRTGLDPSLRAMLCLMSWPRGLDLRAETLLCSWGLHRNAL